MIDELAADFAQRHGSFTLRFVIPTGKAWALSSEYGNWVLTVDSDKERSWASDTIESVIRFADEELSD